MLPRCHGDIVYGCKRAPRWLTELMNAGSQFSSLRDFEILHRKEELLDQVLQTTGGKIKKATVDLSYKGKERIRAIDIVFPNTKK